MALLAKYRSGRCLSGSIAGWVIRSQTGRVVGRMPDGALYFEWAYFPWVDNEPNHDALEEAMADVMWNIPSPPGPLVEGPDGDRLLVEGARHLRESTDRAIMGLYSCNLMEWGQYLYRNDNFLALLAGEPDRAHDILERLTEFHLKGLEKVLKLVGQYVDVINFSDDLGMQTGPMISPRMYREFFKPASCASDGSAQRSSPTPRSCCTRAAT